IQCYSVLHICSRHLKTTIHPRNNLTALYGADGANALQVDFFFKANPIFSMCINTNHSMAFNTHHCPNIAVGTLSKIPYPVAYIKFTHLSLHFFSAHQQRKRLPFILSHCALLLGRPKSPMWLILKMESRRLGHD